MNTKYTFFFVILFAAMHAQVGINTKTPEKTLDINGDINLRKELRLGGDATHLGSAGQKGSLFYNNTSLLMNSWNLLQVAQGQTELSVYTINSTTDTTGVTYTDKNLGVPYRENTSIANWEVLAGNTVDLSITKPVNRVVLNFQTTAQKNSDKSASYACGIFVDDQLKGVRSDVVVGTSTASKVFNLNMELTNLEVKDYKVKVACIGRYIPQGTNLGIGRPIDTSSLNPFMAKSILTTTVLQPYE